MAVVEELLELEVTLPRVVDSAPMPSESIDSRIQSLNDKMANLALKVANIEGRLSAIPEKKTHPILITFLTIVGAAMLGFFGWVGNSIVSLDRDVGILTHDFLNESLRGASAQPTSNESIAQVEKIIDTAEERKIAIPLQTVSQVGQSFVDASKNNQASWKAVVKLMNYRSDLNESTVDPSIRSAGCVGGLETETGKTIQISSSLLSNCTQVLDHAIWKDVFFENVTVVYHDGPVTLENVHFKNCQFSIVNTANSQEFAKSILTSDSVSATLPAV
jgi:hypothetical protein